MIDTKLKSGWLCVSPGDVDLHVALIDMLNDWKSSHETVLQTFSVHDSPLDAIQDRDNLRLLCQRLVRRLDKVSPGEKIVDQARGYLAKHADPNAILRNH